MTGRTADGRIVISLVNLDPHRAAHIDAGVAGMHAVSGRILTATTMDAHNTFEQPDAVRPASFDGAVLNGGTLSIDLPAKSLVVLELH